MVKKIIGGIIFIVGFGLISLSLIVMYMMSYFLSSLSFYGIFSEVPFLITLVVIFVGLLICIQSLMLIRERTLDINIGKTNIITLKIISNTLFWLIFLFSIVTWIDLITIMNFEGLLSHILYVLVPLFIIVFSVIYYFWFKYEINKYAYDKKQVQKTLGFNLALSGIILLLLIGSNIVRNIYT